MLSETAGPLQDAVAQDVERGYAVSEVAERLGISTKSLYTWKTQFSKPVRAREAEADLVAELRRVKKELARVTEERTILKNNPGFWPACAR
jgi:transposase